MSKELKPCPFCGGKAIRGMFNIWCERCGAETRQDVDASEKKIIKVWNRRAK